MAKKAEHIEYLDGGVKLIVSPEHTFGTDALLLAAFSRPRVRETAMDLGAGCGILPFLWFRDGCRGDLYAVDIQKDAIDLMQRSLRENPQIRNIFPLHADLRELPDHFPRPMDMIVMNPPYFPEGSGAPPQIKSAQIARHDGSCTLAQLCESAAKMVKFGGRLAVSIPPHRLCDLFCAMRESRIEPKRARFVCQREHAAPWLVLVEGRRGGKSGLRVENNLLIESEEMEKILRPYRKDR